MIFILNVEFFVYFQICWYVSSLGRCISICVWQNLIIFISLVLNNFIQNLFTTKS